MAQHKLKSPFKQLINLNLLVKVIHITYSKICSQECLSFVSKTNIHCVCIHFYNKNTFSSVFVKICLSEPTNFSHSQRNTATATSSTSVFVCWEDRNVSVIPIQIHYLTLFDLQILPSCCLHERRRVTYLFFSAFDALCLILGQIPCCHTCLFSLNGHRKKNETEK